MCVSSLCSPGRCSLSLVYVFVCVISVLLLHVLLRCFLEPSHTCFLTSIVCSESDRLLDTHRDRIYQGSSTFWSAIFLQWILLGFDTFEEQIVGSCSVLAGRNAYGAC